MRTPEWGSVKCTKPDHPPDGRLFGLAFDDVDAGGVELGGDRVHHLGVADLPAHIRDVFGFVAGRVHDEPVMPVVHAQVQVAAIAVGGDFVPEHLLGVLRPHIQIVGADPDVGQFVDLLHADGSFLS